MLLCTEDLEDYESRYATLVIDGVEQIVKRFKHKGCIKATYIMIDWLQEIAKDSGAESNEYTFIKITDKVGNVLSKHTIDGYAL